MDAAGFQWFSVEVLGVLALGLVLLFVVIRSSKRNKGEAGVETSERATHDLYAEEDRREKSGTDKSPD